MSKPLTAEEFFLQQGRVLSYNFEWYELMEQFAQAKVKEYIEENTQSQKPEIRLPVNIGTVDV